VQPSRRCCQLASGERVTAQVVGAAVADLARRRLAERDAAHGAPGPVRLSSTFLLRRDGGRLRVVLYLNHQDLGTVLSEA
jgi:hypothetical protein